jgi:hypothetical protein
MRMPGAYDSSSKWQLSQKEVGMQLIKWHPRSAEWLVTVWFVIWGFCTLNSEVAQCGETSASDLVTSNRDLSGGWYLSAIDPEGYSSTAGDASSAGERWRRVSGIYPHLAATSRSWTECGIGAVVPWAGKLWYVSYVAHIVGEGVGLYEISADLTIRKRPESVVGTHAGRVVHRESQQLFLGPYAIDSQGNVRVIDGLLRERITAYARHLFEPHRLVYAQAMEGKLYEVDVETLAVREVVDLTEVLAIREGRSHFKGAYTSQGRLVVANNTYDSGDQIRGWGGGRLAEWDGRTWKIVQRTAYCEVTTAPGVWAVPNDPGPLWATGWDRNSLILSVLAEGRWHHFRLPKASQTYDHAWSTEWPRIHRIAPQTCLLDMHGMFFRMADDFQPAHASIEPFAAHLRMIPDFCIWEGQLVLAGNQNSAMLFGTATRQQPRHRTGGQPQSNLWFGSLEELGEWGEVHGWGEVEFLPPPQLRGGEATEAEKNAALPYTSDPILVRGYNNRTLFLVWKSPKGFPRCTGQFLVEECPKALSVLPRVTIRRGEMTKPGEGYRFVVNQPVVVYLAVHDRGDPKLPPVWRPTSYSLRWRHDQVYTDRVYEAEFSAGEVLIPEHTGRNALGHYGVPHMCFVAPKVGRLEKLEITELPSQLGAEVNWPLGRVLPGEKVRVIVEVDRKGDGHYEPLREFVLSPGEEVWWQLADGAEANWIRLSAEEPVPISLVMVANPLYSEGLRQGNRFRGLSAADSSEARIGGAMLPLAEKLWVWANVEAAGQCRPLGFFRVEEDLAVLRQEEGSLGGSSSGSFRNVPAWNRQMIATVLVIGRYLVDERGSVREIENLPQEVIVATVRHPAGPERCYLLSESGVLYEVDIASAEVVGQIDIAQNLALEPGQILFRAGHQVGSVLIAGGITADGRSGILVEGSGTTWRVVDTRPFVEVCNLGAMSEEVVAIGWDRASAVWLVRDLAGRWECLRFPKSSPAYEQHFASYWPRIREVETERVLLDCHGIFYEVSGLPYARSIVPVCAHQRLMADFASYRGMLVLMGVSADAEPSENIVADGALRLWFGKTDDLWQLPSPRGRGGPWLQSAVRAGEPSEPFLIYGFPKKILRVRHTASQPVTVKVEVDPTVLRTRWVKVAELVVTPQQEIEYEFPPGFSAHWLRLVTDTNSLITAQLELE